MVRCAGEQVESWGRPERHLLLHRIGLRSGKSGTQDDVGPLLDCAQRFHGPRRHLGKGCVGAVQINEEFLVDKSPVRKPEAVRPTV